MSLQFFGTSRVTPWRDPDTLFFWRCWYLWWPTVVSFVYVEDGSLWPSMYPLIYLTYIIIPLMPTMQWQSRNNHLFSGALVLSHRSSYLFFERKMTPWNMWMNLHYCLLFETWNQCCQLWKKGQFLVDYVYNIELVTLLKTVMKRTATKSHNSDIFPILAFSRPFIFELWTPFKFIVWISPFFFSGCSRLSIKAIYEYLSKTFYGFEMTLIRNNLLLLSFHKSWKNWSTFAFKRLFQKPF